MSLALGSALLVAQCFSLDSVAIPGRGLQLPAQEVLIAQDVVSGALSAGLMTTATGQKVEFPIVQGYAGFDPKPNKPLLAISGRSSAEEHEPATTLTLSVGFQMWIGGAYGTLTLKHESESQTSEVLCRPF
ncbi:MAG: hypothetical protein M3Q07_02175 [Pseudobdellovibrionaceae bacterium]|nr:hypothetical protein [Pseudobdellovibrionaceae bacterium]